MKPSNDWQYCWMIKDNTLLQGRGAGICIATGIIM